MADRSGKTEEPTQRRLEKARKEGQLPQTKEFVSALQFLLFLTLLGTGGSAWLAGLRQTTRGIFALAFARELGVADLIHLVWVVSSRQILPLAVAVMAVAAGTLAFRLATTQGGLSLKKLAPDAARFNPLSRLQSLPGQNLPQVFQALLLLPLFLGAVYAVARDKLESILALPLGSVDSGYRFLGASLMELFWKAALVFLVFGSVDLFRQM